MKEDENVNKETLSLSNKVCNKILSIYFILFWFFYYMHYIQYKKERDDDSSSDDSETDPDTRSKTAKMSVKEKQDGIKSANKVLYVTFLIVNLWKHIYKLVCNEKVKDKGTKPSMPTDEDKGKKQVKRPLVS